MAHTFMESNINTETSRNVVTAVDALFITKQMVSVTQFENMRQTLAHHFSQRRSTHPSTQHTKMYYAHQMPFIVKHFYFYCVNNKKICRRYHFEAFFLHNKKI